MALHEVVSKDPFTWRRQRATLAAGLLSLSAGTWSFGRAAYWEAWCSARSQRIQRCPAARCWSVGTKYSQVYAVRSRTALVWPSVALNAG